ncbi:MAG: polyketide synthase dehydratase domain-containing protein, partial [Rivularia sp. ALOHA_DT_140]|nr:polyketide synthase dehydratase domain-containing protein [Rivularia sp. ALOHA_DT_140]
VIDGQQRLAGISSFGFSGTNAHLVLEETPLQIKNKLNEPSLHLLTLSANNQNSLVKIVQNYLQFLDEYPITSLADICFTANTGRKHFDYRLALVVDSVESLRQKLQTVNIKESKPKTKVVFVFGDEGCKYLGMGRQLYDTQPIFRKALDKCNKLLEFDLDKSLLEVLYNEKTVNSDSKINQLILFSIEYALAQLWLSWGIEPVAVMGEGVGEYVAACMAGVFSLADGFKLITQREQPNIQDKIITKKIEYLQPQINIISNITGKFIETQTVTQADYWYNPVREKINFVASFNFLQEQECELFIEINNHPILRKQAEQYLPPENLGNWLPCLQENQSDWQVLLQSLAALYEKGVEVNWDKFYQNNDYNRLQLPTYPFERQRYWIDAAKYQPRKIVHQQSHPLLGEKLSSPLSQIQFESLLTLDTLPLVKDHRIGGIPIMNLVVYLEIAFAGAATLFDNQTFTFTDIIVPTALSFPDGKTRRVQLILNSQESSTTSFQIFSQNEGQAQNNWTLHAGGKLSLNSTEILQSLWKKVSLEDIQSRCEEEISSINFYQMMTDK